MDPGEDPRQTAPYGPLLVGGDGLPHAACMQAQIEERGNMPAPRRGSFWKQRVSELCFCYKTGVIWGILMCRGKSFGMGLERRGGCAPLYKEAIFCP